MQTLTFMRTHPPYNAGEVAAFPDDEAAALVASGAAHAVPPEDPPVPLGDGAPGDGAPAPTGEDPPAPAGDGDADSKEGIE